MQQAGLCKLQNVACLAVRHINNFTTSFERHQSVGQERSSATTEDNETTNTPNGRWAFQWLFSCKKLLAPSKSDFMGQQINFGSFTSKHGTF
jgi:hypothetical protein